MDGDQEQILNGDSASQEEIIKLSTIQKKAALLDNIHFLPPFSGEGSVTFGDFKSSFEGFSELLEWSEQEKKFALLQRASGTAAQIIKLHRNKSSEEIFKILKDRYTYQVSPDVALSKFFSFKQPPNMPVQEFYDKAFDLSLSVLKIDGIASDVVEQSQQAMLHSMLIANLTPEIKRGGGVITKDPKTPKETLQYALLEEKALKSIKIASTFLPSNDRKL